MPRLRNIATTTAAAGLMLAVVFATETASAVQLYGSVAVGPPATRGTIVSVNQTNSNISYTIGDPTTRGGLTGLAFDNSAPGPSGSLWGSQAFGFGSTSRLIEIDPDDGSLISSVGAFHTDPNDVEGSDMSIGDLAFNPVDGKLYAITSDQADPNQPGPVDGIYTVDTGTGLATLVGKTIWDTVAGIAFDSNGTLYALGFDPDVDPGIGGTNMLFTFDLDNLIYDDTDPLLLEDNTRVTVDVNNELFNGLGINPLTNEIYATEAYSGDVYKVDPNTGTMTYTGTPGPGLVSDLTFRVPEPGTLAVMGLGLLGLAFMRRRRAL
ncbi:MAG: PEP-CTERM sorting domain-containing protein [Rhodospirillaceae bacterium]|nr:PEP-CTERM sorting domain-containing protein [Rhodospirillaceae bacterium]